MSVPGWNDPPQFSHTSLDTQGIRRSKLTKRPSPTPPSSHLPPPTSTTSPHNPPPLSQNTPPPTKISDSGVAKETEQPCGVTDSIDGAEDYSRVIDGLQAQLEHYTPSMEGREVEEVRKRLEAMRRQWQNGELSTPVRTKMAALLQALEAGEISTAQNLQVALMVDHTSEVSQWMMGVKRLISRAQKAVDT